MMMTVVRVMPSSGMNAVFSPGGGPFAVKVLEVAGDRAVVWAGERIIEVRSEIPLAAGEEFLVEAERRGDGTVAWRVVGEIARTGSKDPRNLPGENLQRSPQGEPLRYAFLEFGVPLSEVNFQKARQLLQKLGADTPAAALAAAAYLQSGLESEDLLEFMFSFFSRLLSAGDQVNEGSTKELFPGGIAPFSEQDLFSRNGATLLRARLQEIAEAIIRLSGAFREDHGRDPGTPVTPCWDDLTKLLLAGQVFARLRASGRDGVFYYIPLFLVASGVLFSDGELLVCPCAEERDAECCRVLLLLETEKLGKMQIDVFFREGNLTVGAVVEREGTKLLFDRYWPELACVLQQKNYRVHWSGCRVGVLSREKPAAEPYCPLDLLV